MLICRINKRQKFLTCNRPPRDFKSLNKRISCSAQDETIYTPRVIVAILKIKKRDALLLYFLKCFLALLVILLDSLHADNINKLLARYAVEMTQVLIVNVHMPISPATMIAFILHSSYATTQYPMRC